MRFYGQGTGVNGLVVAKVTAGWIVKRYDASMDEVDMIAGAFDTPDEAVESGRSILNRELDALLSQIKDQREAA